jgi:hypothetical protein
MLISPATTDRTGTGGGELIHWRQIAAEHHYGFRQRCGYVGYRKFLPDGIRIYVCKMAELSRKLANARND